MQALAVLSERERWSRELLEALPAAVYTTDAAGRITFYNQAAVDFSGRRPELGSDEWCVTWRLYQPDGTPMPHDECPMAVALKENRAVRGAEAIAERPDGTRVPFIPYPTPLRDASGNVIGAVNMLVDITERKRAEEALRESEQRHRALTEAIAAVVWTTRPDGQGEDMPQWRALTGQNRQEVRGFGWLDAIHPNDHARTHEVWTRAVRMAIPCDTECRIRTADGDHRWYDVRGVPVLHDDGSIREWVGVCIDITERKQAEEKARLLAREVNHRANNLLTLMGAMMRQTRAETVPDFIASMQGRINALARVQNRLARDQWERTYMRKLIDEELAPFAKDISGRFRIVGPDVPLGPEAAQALAITIHELATNAVKYGSLSISVGRVAIEWAISGGALTLSWTEAGGPVIQEPRREGFGTRAISALSQRLGGTVSPEWRREGLVCTLKIPAPSLEE